jgi:hypothetical protein
VISDQNGVEFNFYSPIGVEELGYDDHGSGWANLGEVFTVDAAYGFPVGGVGEIYAGSDDVCEGRAGSGEDFGGDFKYAAGLGFRIGVVCAYWAGAGDVDVVVGAHGAGEADDGFVGRGAGKVLAGHGVVALPWDDYG